MTDDLLRDPLGLPQLRLWIVQMISNYETIVASRQLNLDSTSIKSYRKSLTSVKRTCDGNSHSSSRYQMRELLAIGALNYGAARTTRQEELIPEQVVIDFAVFMLWPIVLTPKLPKSWYAVLIEMTSAPLAGLVLQARLSRDTNSPLSVQEFGQILAQIWFAPGILRLLDDLADPRRGGCALTALLIANTGRVPQRRTSKELARWALAAALGGIIGNRADDALTDVWNWLVEYTARPYVLHQNSHQDVPNWNGHKGVEKRSDRYEEILRGLGGAASGMAINVEEQAHLVHKAIDEILHWF